MGPRAAAAAVGAPAAAVAVAGVVRLAVVARLALAAVSVAVLGEAVAVQPGQDGGEEEHDAVHDAEGEAGLEQGARLVGVDAHARAVDAKEAKVDVVGGPRRDVGAVGARDEAQVVDARDQGPDEG